MNAFILDRYGNTLCSMSSNHNGKHAMTFYDDTWTQTKGMPDTFEFTVALDKSYHTEHLVELNQVIFQYENEYHLFTITEVEETHGDTGYIRCFCESTTMELLNSVVLPSNHASVSVEKALEIILSDTSWEVGRTEYFPAQNLEMSSFGTVLSEVQNLPNLFGGTPVFRIEYEGGKVTGKYVDYVDRIGSDTGMRFVYGENVENVTRKVDTTNIVTAVIPVGNNDLTIKEIECTEGVHGFNKPIGKYYIEVSEKERSEISTSPYHIFGTLQVETDDPNELAIQGWKHLQDNLVPNIEYEFSPLLLDSKNIPNLGDTVRAIDRDMNNLQLTAEVTEIQISFSDETRNLITLANYEKVESNIEDQIILIQQTLLNSNLDNPLINVSDTDPSIDKELVNGTLWVDTSDSGNGNVVLKEYDNGKWNETLTENTVDTKLDTQKTEITNETDTKLDNQKVEITQETDTKLETLETTILDKIQPIELEIEKIPEIEVQVEKIPAIEAETLKIPQLVTDIDAVEQQTTNLAQKDTQLQSAIDKQAEEVAKVDQAVTQAKADIESANTKIADAKAELETTKTNLSNAKTELLNKINNISVGARNLLVDSNKEVTGFNEFVQFADLAPIFDEHGLIEYTISFDLKSKDVTNENTISVYCQNGNNTKYFISTTYFKVTTEYQRFSLRAIPRLSGQNTDMAMLAFYGMYDTGNIPVVRNVKVEKGNIPTDYTIAPEDIETSITNVETEIDNINGELSTKVSKTEFNALSNKVSANETQINQTSESIKLLATKTELNTVANDLGTLEETVSSNTAQLEVQAGRIATKVTQEQVETIVNTAIESMSSDGQNLVIYGACDDFPRLIDTDTQTTSMNASITTSKELKLKATGSEADNFYIFGTINTLSGLLLDTYTMTMDIKIPSDSTVTVNNLNFVVWESDNSQSTNLSTLTPISTSGEWNRYSVTKTFTNEAATARRFFVRLANVTDYSNAYVLVDNVKIERGSEPTAFTKNPNEMTATELAALKQRVSNAEAKIELNADSIEAKVSKDVYESDLATQNAKISSAESKITANADAIALKVEKTDIIEAINYKSDNKILNGYGEMKDNTNFSTFTYDEENMYNGTPSFSKPQTNFESLANNYIPVDINRKYRLSGNFKSVGVTDSNKTYIGFSSYDVDFNNISPENVMYIKGSTTTLAQDLKNGDTVVYLTDVSGFNKALTPTYQRGFIFWNYKNKSGYQYPVETYSRNVFLDRWADASSFNATNNTITLKTAWTGGTFPSGTSVSQTSAGNTWNYMFGGNTSTIGEEWNHQRLDIISLRDDGLVSNDSFRHGTAYIKFRVRNASTSGTFYMNSISLVDITEMVESEYYTNSKINSTKAEFKVTTDEISSKVTKLETTTANQATTIAKHETSITNNANAIELKASKTELETAVDNISIGGRNLALNTSTDVHLTAGTNKFSYQRYKLPVSLKKGDTLTISVDYTKVAGTATDFYVAIYDYETTTKHLAATILPITGGRTSKTFTITNTNIEGVEYNSLLIYAGRGGETQGNEVIISHVKLEYGNKATDWTPAPEDIDSEISALGTRVTSAESSITQNANQIATKVSKDGVISSINQSAESVTINASKVNLNGQLTIGHFSDALANQVNTASTNASTALTNAATAQSTANTATNKANTAQSTANTATDLARAMATGKLLYKDPTFKSGTNNVLLYNNAGNGMVTVERIAKPADCPTSSTHCMRITSKGETNPALGGIKQLYDHKPSKKFVIRYIIKLPVGYSLHTAGNAGASSDVLVGSAKGTGNYREYIRVVQCKTDTTSTYGNGGYLFVNYDTAEGGTVPTESNPLVWYLAKIECYDVTDGDYAVQDAQATADSAVTVLGNWAYDANKTYINGGNIYTGTIVADKIASNAVTSDKIAANAITSDKIAANTIEAGDIKAGTITSTQIAANTITAGNIAANAVTASEIAANAVTADKINANAVTADKIAANSITAGKISSLNGLNVNDQLIVDSSGNVSFSGDLTGASGTFSGSITQDDDTNGKVTIERSEVKLINNEGTQYTNLLYGGLDIEKTINNVKYDTILQHDTLAFLTGGTVKSQITNNNGALKFEGTSLDFDNLTINNFKTPLNVTVTGAGNVVNGATYDASTQTLNLTKSASFVTASNGVFYNQPKINGNESGYVGIGGYTSETSGNVSGYYCQFKLQHSATPAAVTLTAVSSAGSNKFTNTISQHGFWFYITNTSGAKGYVYWRGTYQTS